MTYIATVERLVYLGLSSLGGTDMAFEIRDHLQSSLGPGYRLSRELSGGGMAHVFTADDPVRKQRVVVKVLSPDLVIGVDGVRFKREIRLASSLNHPRIVPVLQATSANDVLYYTMPYIVGDTLRALLDAEHRLPVAQAVAIARDVADALNYAHSKNVVHRDIKPENVLVERATGNALVTDFGIARAIERAADIAAVTSTGLCLGTPTYMSPEQASAQGDIDGRSDVYSLGCMLYELLAGAPPFKGISERATIAKHMTEPPPDVRLARPDVSEELERVIRRMLAKEPQSRPSAARVITALDGEPLADTEQFAVPKRSRIRDATARLRGLFR